MRQGLTPAEIEQLEEALRSLKEERMQDRMAAVRTLERLEAEGLGMAPKKWIDYFTRALLCEELEITLSSRGSFAVLFEFRDNTVVQKDLADYFAQQGCKVHQFPTAGGGIVTVDTLSTWYRPLEINLERIKRVHRRFKAYKAKIKALHEKVSEQAQHPSIARTFATICIWQQKLIQEYGNLATHDLTLNLLRECEIFCSSIVSMNTGNFLSYLQPIADFIQDQYLVLIEDKDAPLATRQALAEQFMGFLMVFCDLETVTRFLAKNILPQDQAITYFFRKKFDEMDSISDFRAFLKNIDAIAVIRMYAAIYSWNDDGSAEKQHWIRTFFPLKLDEIFQSPDTSDQEKLRRAQKIMDLLEGLKNIESHLNLMISKDEPLLIIAETIISRFPAAITSDLDACNHSPPAESPPRKTELSKLDKILNACIDLLPSYGQANSMIDCLPEKSQGKAREELLESFAVATENCAVGVNSMPTVLMIFIGLQACKLLNLNGANDSSSLSSSYCRPAAQRFLLSLFEAVNREFRGEKMSDETHQHFDDEMQCLLQLNSCFYQMIYFQRRAPSFEWKHFPKASELFQVAVNAAAEICQKDLPCSKLLTNISRLIDIEKRKLEEFSLKIGPLYLAYQQLGKAFPAEYNFPSPAENDEFNVVTVDAYHGKDVIELDVFLHNIRKMYVTAKLIVSSVEPNRTLDCCRETRPLFTRAVFSDATTALRKKDFDTQCDALKQAWLHYLSLEEMARLVSHQIEDFRSDKDCKPHLIKIDELISQVFLGVQVLPISAHAELGNFMSGLSNIIVDLRAPQVLLFQNEKRKALLNTLERLFEHGKILTENSKPSSSPVWVH